MVMPRAPLRVCVCSATRHDGIVQEIGHEQMPAVTVEAQNHDHQQIYGDYRIVPKHYHI